MRISTAVVLVSITIRFTEELPHGPYGEAQTQTSFTIYVPHNATVREAADVLCQLGEDMIKTQAKSMPLSRMSGKFKVVQAKCKGGVVSDDTVLDTILSDGENLQFSLKQKLMVMGCLLC